MSSLSRSCAGARIVLATSALLLLSGPGSSVAAPLVWSGPVHVDTAGAITLLSCPATNFCAAADSANNLLTSDPANATWPATGIETTTPLSLSCGSSAFCAVGDAGGRAMSYSSGSWGARIAPPGQAFAITAMSCTSATFCLAGTSVTTTPRTLDGGVTWEVRNPQGVNFPGSIRAVSCAPGADATTGFCVVVDSSNAAFASSNGGVTFAPPNRPDGVISGASQLNAVSCTSSTACVAVDSAGKVFYYRGGVLGGADWTAVSADTGRQLTSVSCVAGSPANQTFCAAVDASGYEIETSDGGATWTAPALITGSTGTPGLNAVSCPTASFCVAVDNGGNAYTGAPQAVPVNTGSAPTVTNLPAQVGQTQPLGCSNAGVVWSGPAPTVAYRWQRSVSASGTWTDITPNGAAQTYTPVAADEGNLLRCVVTATNAGGATDAASAATDAVLPAPTPPASTGPAAGPPAAPPAMGAPSGSPAAPATDEPAPGTRPSNAYTTRPVRLGRGRRLIVTYVLPGAGEIEVMAHHIRPRTPSRRVLAPWPGRIVLAHGSRVVTEAGRVEIELVLSSIGRRLLHRQHRLHLVLTSRFTPVDGPARESSQMVVVREVAGSNRWTITARA